MKSIRDIYKIGKGPSSSHTMGPAKAMSIYVSEHPHAESYKVVLFGSLADTGVYITCAVIVAAIAVGFTVRYIIQRRRRRYY